MRNDVLEQAKAIRAAMGKVTATLTDGKALAVKELYPLWDGKGVQVYDGTNGVHPQTRVRGRTSGLLYKCNIGHTTQDDWPPETTPNLWTVIYEGEDGPEGHAGTIDDPLPAERGMEYEYGLYYLDPDPEYGGIYLCERTGEAAGGTVVLHFLPHELVGNYFSLVTD